MSAEENARKSADREFIIEECITWLELAGYLGAAKLMRFDLIDRPKRSAGTNELIDHAKPKTQFQGCA